MAVRPEGLLFIEPTKPSLRVPVLDVYTCIMAAAMRCAETGIWGRGGSFNPRGRWKGWHTCSCGATSSNCDYRLPNGMVTNSLALHYLAYHRNEVPNAELLKVEKLIGVLPSHTVTRPLPGEIEKPRRLKGC